MTRYQKVLWHHDFPDEPVELYSEIDAGYEIRKVEVYRDGKYDYADHSRSTGTTMLGEDIVPGTDEINEDPEFTATAIDAEEFRQVWKRATQNALEAQRIATTQGTFPARSQAATGTPPGSSASHDKVDDSNRPVELALDAANALMTAMATDVWSEVHAKAVNLWRRVYPELVPTIESELSDARQEMVAARQAGDTEVEKELSADWRRKYQRLTRDHPELIPELRRLEEEWARLAAAAEAGGTTIKQTNISQTVVAADNSRVYVGRAQHITDR